MISPPPLFSTLQHLDEPMLIERTLTLIREERRITLELIAHLREIDRRMLFADYGYPSLFEFAVKHLGLSEGAAGRRINAMRLIHDIPEVREKIEAGTLSLSAAAQAQRFFWAEKKKLGVKRDANAKREVVAQLENRSARQCEQALYAIAPAATLPRERERAVSAQEIELKIIITDDAHRKLKRVEAHYSHALVRKPASGSWGALLERMADEILRQIDEKWRRPEGIAVALRVSAQVRSAQAQSARTQSARTQSARTQSARTQSARYVPAPLRHLVWARAHGRCEFKTPEGKRCAALRFLEVDHIRPVALGGAATADNLRLLCRAHNQAAAVRNLTEDKMAAYLPHLKPGTP